MFSKCWFSLSVHLLVLNALMLNTQFSFISTLMILQKVICLAPTVQERSVLMYKYTNIHTGKRGDRGGALPNYPLSRPAH